MSQKQKRTIFLFLALLVLLSIGGRAQQVFYVAPHADEKGAGTLEAPFNSIDQAMEAVAKENVSMKEDIVVYLRGGNYSLVTPIIFRQKDSGMNGHKVIYKAYRDEKPVLSGGVKVSGWENVEGHIYKAKLDRDTKLRSLFVNGKRKHMAGTDIPVSGLGNWGRFEVQGNEPWAFGAGSAIDGIKFATEDIKQYKNPEDVELVQFNVWTEKILCAREIEQFGDTSVIKLQQPYGAIATSMAWAGAINYEKDFVIRNAFELLDSPGEFYFDRNKKELYYCSEGEDMATAEVIAPTAEGLIRIEGDSKESRVRNIGFEGITFSYDHWPLMNVAGSHGFAGIQSLGLAVRYVPGGNWHPTKYNSTDVPRGSVQVENAENISFVRNRFEAISSAIAINLVNDVKNSKVEGNYFNDLLGNAVNIGYTQHYEIGDEAKSAKSAENIRMNPRSSREMSGPVGVNLVRGLNDSHVNADYDNNQSGRLEEKRPQQHYRAGVEGLCEHISVANNYIRNISLDFRQVEAITSFFVANTIIEHNDIAGTPYGAITCGWWWGNAEIPASKVSKDNSIRYNKAGDTHQVLDDGGVIYMLGEQPGSRIEGNYVFNGPRCIYPDDGSAYLTITRNVVYNPSYKWMWLHFWTKRCHDNVVFDNYVKNNLLMDNGTNNTIEKTHSYREEEFSGEALKIIDNAGIEEEYKNIMPESEPPKINIYPEDFKEGDVFH